MPLMEPEEAVWWKTRSRKSHDTVLLTNIFFTLAKYGGLFLIKSCWLPLYRSIQNESVQQADLLYTCCQPGGWGAGCGGSCQLPGSLLCQPGLSVLHLDQVSTAKLLGRKTEGKPVGWRHPSCFLPGGLFLVYIYSSFLFYSFPYDFENGRSFWFSDSPSK